MDKGATECGEGRRTQESKKLAGNSKTERYRFSGATVVAAATVVVTAAGGSGSVAMVSCSVDWLILVIKRLDIGIYMYVDFETMSFCRCTGKNEFAPRDLSGFARRIENGNGEKYYLRFIYFRR